MLIESLGSPFLNIELKATTCPRCSWFELVPDCVSDFLSPVDQNTKTKADTLKNCFFNICGHLIMILSIWLWYYDIHWSSMAIEVSKSFSNGLIVSISSDFTGFCFCPSFWWKISRSKTNRSRMAPMNSTFLTPNEKQAPWCWYIYHNLPTFGWFLGQMLVNILYMEHMGMKNNLKS